MTREGIVLVASSLPPSPASITPTPTRAAARAMNPAAVATSNWVTASPALRSTTSAASAALATAEENSSGPISAPPIRIRSDQRSRWGETIAPARTPCASSSAAVIRVTEDLPLVPTTWIEAKRCCGMPSSAFIRCIRSSPSFQPIGSSESR